MLIRNAFLTPYQESQNLTQVTGRFWGDASEMNPLLVELLLHFEQTVVTLAVTEEDEIDTASRISADDQEVHDVDLTGVVPWRASIGNPLLWVWDMTNQLGYLDGVQLEFARNVESKSVTVQLIALGAQLRVREIGSWLKSA